jgi:hypothetical protein
MCFLKFSKCASIISLCDIKKIGFDNWDKESLLWGAKWIFNYIQIDFRLQSFSYDNIWNY